MPGNVLGTPTDPGNNATYYNSGYTIDSPYYRTVVGEWENSPSPYGTFDQGGNVWEWNEAVVYENTNIALRGMRGGSYNHYADSLAAPYRYVGNPMLGGSTGGFRLASVPEPGSITLLVAGAAGLLGFAWRRRERTA